MLHYSSQHVVDVDSSADNAGRIMPRAGQVGKVCPTSVARSHTQDSMAEAVSNNNNNRDSTNDDEALGFNSSSSTGDSSNIPGGLHAVRRRLITGKDQDTADWLSLASATWETGDSRESVDESQTQDDVAHPQQGNSSGDDDDINYSCCNDVACTTCEV